METIKLLAENIAGKIKINKWWINLFKLQVIEAALLAGYNLMPKSVKFEFLQLVKSYLRKDETGMVDEAADTAAEIVKLLLKK